jgi:hypothetical protein
MRQWAAIFSATALAASTPATTLAQQSPGTVSIAVLTANSQLGQLQRRGIEDARNTLASALDIKLDFVDYKNAGDIVNWLDIPANKKTYSLVLGPIEESVLAQLMELRPSPEIPVLAPLPIQEFSIRSKWYFRTNSDLRTRLAALQNYVRWVGRVAVVFEDSETGRVAQRFFQTLRTENEDYKAQSFKAIPLGSPVRPNELGAERKSSNDSIVAPDLTSIASQLRDFRAEAVGVFADPATLSPIREQLNATSVAGRTYSPLLLSYSDPRELAAVPDRLIFASALLGQRSMSEKCKIQGPISEAAALSYDAMALVIHILEEGGTRTGEDFWRRLADTLTKGGSFRGPCTDMAFLELRNITPPVLYEKAAGSVQVAASLSPRSLADLFLNVYGYAPVLIFVFFALCAAVGGYNDGKSLAFANVFSLMSAVAVSGAIIRLILSTGLFILVAVFMRLPLDFIPFPIIIALLAESIYRIGGLLETVTDPVAHWAARWPYRNHAAAVNIVAISNTRQDLDQAVRQTIAPISNDNLRQSVEKKLASDLEGQRTAEAQRRTLADWLLRRLRWDELIERGMVPRRYSNKTALEDPEPAVRRGVDYFVMHDISADDLDIFIRSQLDERPTSFAVAYERTLLEGATEPNEGQRLAERVRFTVRLLGMEYLKSDLEDISSAIGERKRRSPAQTATSPRRGELPMLVLLRVELENIRCFRKLSLNFSFDGGGRPWTMVLGDNGLGKTTILRAIAIGLCDQPSATSFMTTLPGELLRQETDVGSIRVELGLTDRSEVKAWSETKLTRGLNGTVELTQSRSDWFPRDRLFACGYGALRSAFGTVDFSGYAIPDAMRTLFDASAPLQNPELALRRMESAGQDIALIRHRLENVLGLPEDSAQITPSGITIRGPWGQFIPARAIGDGYLATLSWLSDLIGWAFLFRPSFLSNDISGIVLIDEIEKHLHPRWQREIVRQLASQFPKLQFIATTHSPLCAGGLADLEHEEQGMMYCLWNTGSGAVEGEALLPFRGWSYDQIMTSKAFGLPVPRDITTQEIVAKLRSAREAGEFEKENELSEELKSRSPHAAEDERSRAVREEITRKLEEVQEHLRRSEP